MGHKFFFLAASSRTNGEHVIRTASLKQERTSTVYKLNVYRCGGWENELWLNLTGYVHTPPTSGQNSTYPDFEAGLMAIWVWCMPIFSLHK